jgi:hypothetical protein
VPEGRFLPGREPQPKPEEAGIETCAESCSIQQIAAMARAGLSDEQILAACARPEAEPE